MFVRLFVSLLFALLGGFQIAVAQDSTKETIRFGVFAYQGIEATTKEYAPLIAYLNAHSKSHFELIVACQKPLDALIAQGEVDIVTTNPIHFLDIRQRHKLSGAIATLMVKHSNGKDTVSSLGGLIVVSSKSDIVDLKGIENKRIIAPSTRHMGGYRAQAYTLFQAGIALNPKTIIQTKGSHQEVLHRLKAGEADVGFIRDGIWESMIAQGEIEEKDFRILNLQQTNHPFTISTSLYPEWPVFALGHVNTKKVKHILGLLYSLDDSDPILASSRIAGYTLPADYLETEELSRALRLPPFDDVAIITMQDVWKQYQINILFILAVLFFLGIYTFKERKNKILFKALLTHMEDAAYALDRDGYCVWINNQALELLGFERGEILNKNPHAIFHHHRLDTSLYDFFDSPIYHTLEDRYLREIEEHFIRKDGSFLSVHLTVAPIESTQGAIVIFHDISTQKAQHKALQESEKLFRTLFELFPESIVIYDTSTHLPIAFNEAAYTQMGYTREEFEQVPIGQYDAVETPQQTQAHAQKILQEGFDSFDTHHRLKDGRIIDVHVTVKVIQMQEKHYFLTLIRNITPIVMYQKTLHDAKERAEEANNAKSTFLSNMSHEIRTPLSAIIGLSELLLQMTLHAKERDYVTKILHASKMLLSIINDILDYSKIEANKMNIEPHDVVLAEFVEHLRLLFPTNILKNRVSLDFNIDPKLPTVIHIDDFRLTQVLTNFLSNALKFTAQGNIKLSITLKEQLTLTHVVLRFEVQDTGIGIAPDNLSKLFSPFMQADSSITRQYGGTGLGLVISKKILEGMQSTLYVKSELGRGSLFGFDLHVSVVSWEGVAPAAQTSSQQKEYDLKGLRVLLVDDNTINQEIAKAMLEFVGIEVTLAGNGLEAFETYRDHPSHFDTILMDLQMPVMSGYQSAKEIRQIDSQIPIIALTAAALVEDKNKVIEAQMNDHLSKPIDTQQLYAVIAKWNNRATLDAIAPQRTTDMDEPILDRKFALKMVMGNEKVLDKLLLTLRKQLQGEFSNIVDQIAQEAPDVPARIHALKGVTGNLGAKALYATCKTIDEHYKKNAPISTQLQERLSTTLTMLQDLLASVVAPQEEVQLPLEGAITTHIDNIKNDLQRANKISSSHIEALLLALQGRVESAQLKAWRDAIEDFEYEQALQIMQEWKL